MIFTECVCSNFRVPCEKSTADSLASLIMKDIIVFPARSRFPVKLICCIPFGSASSACCFLRSIAISL